MAEVLTGCRARFKLNGVVVGYATGVTLRQAITYEPIKTLDSIVTKSFEPTDYDVNMTADMVRIVGDTIKSNGWFPQQGVSEADFLTNIITSGELSATLEDNQTSQIVALVEGLKISESNLNVSARGVVGENVSFVARRARDESDLAA